MSIIRTNIAKEVHIEIDLLFFFFCLIFSLDVIP